MLADTKEMNIDGSTVRIRPIKPGDEDIEATFMHQLSPTAKRYRFLGGVRNLSPEQLEKFCNVDGDKTMAFVAMIDQDGEELQIGVSRYAPDTDVNTREIAITVADGWHDRGLDAALAERLVTYARDHGVTRLYSVELAENDEMRRLAKQIGMTATRDSSDARQVIYTLTL